MPFSDAFEKLLQSWKQMDVDRKLREELRMDSQRLHEELREEYRKRRKRPYGESHPYNAFIIKRFEDLKLNGGTRFKRIPIKLNYHRSRFKKSKSPRRTLDLADSLDRTGLAISQRCVRVKTVRMKKQAHHEKRTTQVKLAQACKSLGMFLDSPSFRNPKDYMMIRWDKKQISDTGVKRETHLFVYGLTFLALMKIYCHVDTWIGDQSIFAEEVKALEHDDPEAAMESLKVEISMESESGELSKHKNQIKLSQVQQKWGKRGFHKVRFKVILHQRSIVAAEKVTKGEEPFKLGKSESLHTRRSKYTRGLTVRWHYYKVRKRKEHTMGFDAQSKDKRTIVSRVRKRVKCNHTQIATEGSWYLETHGTCKKRLLHLKKVAVQRGFHRVRFKGRSHLRVTLYTGRVVLQKKVSHKTRKKVRKIVVLLTRHGPNSFRLTRSLKKWVRWLLTTLFRKHVWEPGGISVGEWKLPTVSGVKNTNLRLYCKLMELLEVVYFLRVDEKYSKWRSGVRDVSLARCLRKYGMKLYSHSTKRFQFRQYKLNVCLKENKLWNKFAETGGQERVASMNSGEIENSVKAAGLWMEMRKAFCGAVVKLLYLCPQRNEESEPVICLEWDPGGVSFEKVQIVILNIRGGLLKMEQSMETSFANSWLELFTRKGVTDVTSEMLGDGKVIATVLHINEDEDSFPQHAAYSSSLFGKHMFEYSFASQVWRSLETLSVSYPAAMEDEYIGLKRKENQNPLLEFVDKSTKRGMDMLLQNINNQVNVGRRVGTSCLVTIGLMFHFPRPPELFSDKSECWFWYVLGWLLYFGLNENLMRKKWRGAVVRVGKTVAGCRSFLLMASVLKRGVGLQLTQNLSSTLRTRLFKAGSIDKSAYWVSGWTSYYWASKIKTSKAHYITLLCFI